MQIDELVNLKQKYKELQEAHLQQSDQMQKMQITINKINSYKSTIETQEKVISKMQNVIESKIKSKGMIPTLVDKKDYDKFNNIDPSIELHESKKKIASLEAKVIFVVVTQNLFIIIAIDCGLRE